VNNIDMLSEAITAEPLNSILQYMLVDELMEEKDMTVTEAWMKVASVVSHAFYLQHFARAAELLSAASDKREELLKQVAQSAGVTQFERVTVFLVVGSSPPKLCRRPGGQQASAWGNFAVTVGASWVCGLT